MDVLRRALRWYLRAPNNAGIAGCSGRWMVNRCLEYDIGHDCADAAASPAQLEDGSDCWISVQSVYIRHHDWVPTQSHRLQGCLGGHQITDLAS